MYGEYITAGTNEELVFRLYTPLNQPQLSITILYACLPAMPVYDGNKTHCFTYKFSHICIPNSFLIIPT